MFDLIGWKSNWIELLCIVRVLRGKFHFVFHRWQWRYRYGPHSPPWAHDESFPFVRRTASNTPRILNRLMLLAHVNHLSNGRLRKTIQVYCALVTIATFRPFFWTAVLLRLASEIALWPFALVWLVVLDYIVYLFIRLDIDALLQDLFVIVCRTTWQVPPTQ